MNASTIRPYAGDIGEEEIETVEMEPLPEEAPVTEPKPEVVPAEPVPA